MKESMKVILIAVVFGLLTLGALPGCEKKGAAEKAGENIDEAVQDVKREVEDATD